MRNLKANEGVIAAAAAACANQTNPPFSSSPFLLPFFCLEIERRSPEILAPSIHSATWGETPKEKRSSFCILTPPTVTRIQLTLVQYKQTLPSAPKILYLLFFLYSPPDCVSTSCIVIQIVACASDHSAFITDA